MSAPKTECETLMGATMPFAEQMLRSRGQFLPYGSALLPTGEVTLLANPDEREQAPAPDIVSRLKQGLKAGAKSGAYKATALVSGVTVTLPSGEKSDAVEIALNHRDDYSVVVFFPYELKDGTLSYGEMLALEGAADIFPSRRRTSWFQALFSTGRSRPTTQAPART